MKHFKVKGSINIKIISNKIISLHRLIGKSLKSLRTKIRDQNKTLSFV